MISKLTDKLGSLATQAYVRVDNDPRLALFMLGAALLVIGLEEQATAQEQTQKACKGLMKYIEGSFGALVTAAAGIGAIIAAAVGGFKAAWTLLVTAIGAFILRSYIKVFFTSAACTTA